MRYLRDSNIEGHPADVGMVKELFGSVYLGGPFADPERLLVRRFRNVYKDSSGATPLFMLIPIDCPIENVWPEGLFEIKCGTAWHNGAPWTRGMVMHRADNIGLYICFEPAGYHLEDTDSFGI